MVESGRLASITLRNDIDGNIPLPQSGSDAVEFLQMYEGCIGTFRGWEGQATVHPPKQHLIHIGVDEEAGIVGAIQCVAIIPTSIDALRTANFDYQIHEFREYFPTDFRAFPRLEDRMMQCGYSPEEISEKSPWYARFRSLFFDLKEHGGHTYVNLSSDISLEAFENFVFSTLPDDMFPMEAQEGDARVRYALGLVYDGWKDALRINGESAHHYSYWFDSELRAQISHVGEVWEPEEVTAIPSDPIAQWIESYIAKGGDPQRFHVYTDEQGNPYPGMYWYEMRQRPDRPIQYSFFALDQHGFVHIEHGNEQVFDQGMLEGMSESLRNAWEEQLERVGEFYYVPSSYFPASQDGSFPAAVYLQVDANNSDFYDRMDKILGFLHAL